MKTNKQRIANVFDCDLYRLITQASRNSEDDNVRDSEAWKSVERALRGARMTVRILMHPEDRDGTEGE